MKGEFIYHITTQSQWEEALKKGSKKKISVLLVSRAGMGKPLSLSVKHP